MGFLNKAPERIPVEVLQSTHGQTFVTWPTDVVASGVELPALPVGHSHQRSRHWVMADRTLILILPGDPQVHQGGVVRHTYNIVRSSWNNRTKTLTSIVEHPSDPEITFAVTTSGVGCACTQGPAGNAGPIEEPYKVVMANPNAEEFDWYEVIIP